MRIVIDMQGAQSESRFRGIGRYTLSLTLAIAQNPRGHDIWLALSAAYPEYIEHIRQAFDGLIPKEKIKIFMIPLPTAERDPYNKPRARVAELLYEEFLDSLNPDIVLIGSLFDEGYLNASVVSVGKLGKSYKTAAILYDLIPLLNAEKYLQDPGSYDYYMRRVSTLKRADLLLSISESSKREAIEALDIPEEKVATISCAVDDSFQRIELPKEEKVRLFHKFGIKRKMLLYAPGGFDNRKNFEGLIEAYSRIPQTLRNKHQLVIVSKILKGDHYRLTKLAKQCRLSDDELVLTGYVAHDELIALYSYAELFIFPSRHEGFGLPILEAMACSAPVIGSNTTSIPEVIGLKEALFDPDSIEEMSEKIRKALEDTEFRKNLRAHAQVQVKCFSWDRSAKLALENIEKSVDASKSSLHREEIDIIEAIAQIYEKENPIDLDLEQIAFSLAFNEPTSRPSQLLLDISVLVNIDAKSGIQRVVRSILFELLQSPPETYLIRPVYYDLEQKQYRYAKHFVAKLLDEPQKDLIDDVADFKQGDTYLALDITAHLIHEVYDFYNYLRTIGVEVYFIIYDILFARHPKWWVEAVSVNFNEWLTKITEVATGFCCISQATADDLQQWLSDNPSDRLTPPTITHFHLGSDIENSLPSRGLPDNAQATLQKLRSHPSFLMVGTVEPRKGHQQVLKAFEILWNNNREINLVIVGKEGWLVDELISRLRAHPQKERHLFWLEGISDEYLENIYSASSCLIAASEGEGFGLPLIEAAQHKLPIIARDIPVFREVAGDFAYYFKNDKTPNILANTIDTWLQLYQEDKHPKSEDMPRTSWKESAIMLIESLPSDSIKETT